MAHEGPHSITAPDLSINQLIIPGNEVGDDVQPVTTTFTITPTKKGVFRWHCIPPCDAGHRGWAMTDGFGGPGQEGFMAGYIVVV